MKVERFVLGFVATNAYLLYDEQTKKAIVMDPSHHPEALLDRLKQLELQVEAILLTHAHFDHIGGVEEVRSFTGADVYLHQAEQDWLTEPSLNGSALFPMVPETICQPAEQILTGGETLSWLGKSFEVIHTPGHSPGSVSFFTDGMVFGGDVLFERSIGRTDLPGGNHAQLIKTIRDHFFVLPDDTLVYPGHGEITYIGTEKKENPFL
ncbi:MBL fold metallo-hydrolase [Risungbinella massiliensis]|uniref:MBL fold metallo-hydrolase n=1 Tax=Risungbinella massiliensis TaxID=1329796 RepID=UPI0005CC28FD|nr:MBL fold metallo-hydrolase [Risungbinella massiliensis]